MRVRGADARQYVPGKYARCMGAMRVGGRFIDWSGVYAEAKTKRRAPIRIDYIMCQMCGERIDLHRGPGVTHIAGIALCAKCAEKD